MMEEFVTSCFPHDDEVLGAAPLPFSDDSGDAPLPPNAYDGAAGGECIDVLADPDALSRNGSIELPIDMPTDPDKLVKSALPCFELNLDNISTLSRAPSWARQTSPCSFDLSSLDGTDDLTRTPSWGPLSPPRTAQLQDARFVNADGQMDYACVDFMSSLFETSKCPSAAGGSLPAACTSSISTSAPASIASNYTRSGRAVKPASKLVQAPSTLSSTPREAPGKVSGKNKSASKGGTKRKLEVYEAEVYGAASESKNAQTSSYVPPPRLAHKLQWVGAPRPADGVVHGEKLVVAGCTLLWDEKFSSDGGSWTHPRAQAPATYLLADESARADRAQYERIAKENRALQMARLKAKGVCGRRNGARHYKDRGTAADKRRRVGGRFVKESELVWQTQDELAMAE